MAFAERTTGSLMRGWLRGTLQRAGDLGPWSSMAINLRSKIVLLTVAISLLTAILIGLVAQVRTAEIARGTIIAGVTGETRVLMQRIEATVDGLAQDVLIASRAPAVKGSLEALYSGDTANSIRWKAQLEQHFSSILIARHAFVDASLVGIWNDGTRVGGVYRDGGGLLRDHPASVPPDGDLNWLRRASELGIGDVLMTTEMPPGQSILARVSTPVALMGSRIAVVSLTVSLDRLLAPLLRYPDHVAAVVIQEDDGTLRMGTGTPWTIGPLQSSAVEARVRDLMPSGGSTYLWHADRSKIAFLAAPAPRSWRHGIGFAAALTLDRAVLEAPARAAQWTTFLLTALLCALALVSSLYAAYRITRPLDALTGMIAAARDLDSLQDLPVGRRDEIGGLARAFQDLGARLRRSETGAQSILDTVTDGVLVFGDGGKVRLANPAAARIFDADGDGLVERDIREIFDLEDGGIGVQSLPSEITRMEPGGTLRHYSVGLSHCRDRADGFTTAVLRDVTAAREMETRKAEFIATVSHELRTPLTGIRSSLLLLRHTAASGLSEQGMKFLGLAIGNTDRLSRLVDDILSAEKMASGRMTYRVSRIELAAVITDLLADTTALAHAHSVRFVADIVDSPLTAMLDRARFEQVMMNLMSNAAKFSDDGSKVTLRLSRQPDNRVRVSIIDRGPGIPEAFRDQVFDRFTRADASTNAVQAGTGLGLSIAKAMVDAMHGRLWFETEIGVGTAFHVDFALSDPEP